MSQHSRIVQKSAGMMTGTTQELKVAEELSNRPLVVPIIGQTAALSRTRGAILLSAELIAIVCFDVASTRRLSEHANAAYAPAAIVDSQTSYNQVLFTNNSASQTMPRHALSV